MNESLVVWLVLFINGILLGIAGWHDLKYRSVSLGLLLAINLSPMIYFWWQFDWIIDETVWYVIYFLLVFVMAAFVKLIGLADAFVAVAVALLILGAESAHRYTLLITLLFWTGFAVILWHLWRIIKSLRISGCPKNLWDIIALKMGRLEKEPELTNYLHNQLYGQRFNWFIYHLEVFRTPDGYHLYSDSCPLITCFAIGYIGMMITWLCCEWVNFGLFII